MTYKPRVTEGRVVPLPTLTFSCGGWEGAKGRIHLPFLAWVTVKVLPAIVRVPFRETLWAFGWTLKFTVPAAISTPVMVIQLGLLTAVHVHPLPITVTFTIPVPPEEPKDCLMGEIE